MSSITNQKKFEYNIQELTKFTKAISYPAKRVIFNTFIEPFNFDNVSCSKYPFIGRI